MNNLSTYDNFINEGLFFGKKKPKEEYEQDDDLIYQIINKLEKGINLRFLKYDCQYHYSAIKTNDRRDILSYTYRITKNKLNPLDPYGEEQWGDETENIMELVIKISREREDSDKNKRVIKINSVEQTVSDKAFYKLWNIFENAESIEKERLKKEAERIRLEKLKEEDERRRERSAAVKSSFMDFLKEYHKNRL